MDRRADGHRGCPVRPSWRRWEFHQAHQTSQVATANANAPPGDPAASMNVQSTTVTVNRDDRGALEMLAVQVLRATGE